MMMRRQKLRQALGSRRAPFRIHGVLCKIKRFFFFFCFPYFVVSVGRRWHEWQEPWLPMLAQFLAPGRRTRFEQVKNIGLNGTKEPSQ